MEYHRLGRSDLELSAITFGAWAIGGWLWGQQNCADAVRGHPAGHRPRRHVDRHGSDLRFRPERGDRRRGRQRPARRGADSHEVRPAVGSSGRGGVLLQHDRRQGPCGLKIYRNSRPDSVIDECEQSLQRLHTDRIDLLQIHWPDPTTPIEDTFGAIGRLIEQGKVLAAGVSNYSAEQMAAAHAVVPLASSQPPYSMINRGADDEIIPWCIQMQGGRDPVQPAAARPADGQDHRGPRVRRGRPSRRERFFRGHNVRKVNEFLGAKSAHCQRPQGDPGPACAGLDAGAGGITAAAGRRRNVTRSRRTRGPRHRADRRGSESHRRPAGRPGAGPVLSGRQRRASPAAKPPYHFSRLQQFGA